MVSVMSASSYVTSASRYQSRSSNYIRGLIQRNSMELAGSVPIDPGLDPEGSFTGGGGGGHFKPKS